MTWFKIDDGFRDHKKVRKLGKDRLAAVGLWTLAGGWSAATLSDGFVPDTELERWDPTGVLTARLVEVGLWQHASDDGEQGIQFHDWSEWQPTRDQVVERRREDAERKARWREKQKQSREESRRDTTPDSGRPSHGESRTPDPTRPDPARPGSPPSEGDPGRGLAGHGAKRPPAAPQTAAAASSAPAAAPPGGLDCPHSCVAGIRVDVEAGQVECDHQPLAMTDAQRRIRQKLKPGRRPRRLAARRGARGAPERAPQPVAVSGTAPPAAHEARLYAPPDAAGSSGSSTVPELYSAAS